MKSVIAYSGGIDSTAVAIQQLREHPEVEWTLCFVNMGQTSAAAQRVALDEMVRRHPAFRTHIINVDLGFNPTTVLPNGLVLQNPGTMPTLFAWIASYARYLDPESGQVFTGYDRWGYEQQVAFDVLSKGTMAVVTAPVIHLSPTPLSIQEKLDRCGVTWEDVAFTVSCSGDPRDPHNPLKVPCGVCPKCREREPFNA